MPTDFKVIMAGYVSAEYALLRTEFGQKRLATGLGIHQVNPQENLKPSEPEPASEGFYCGEQPLEKALEALYSEGWEIVCSVPYGIDCLTLVYTLKRSK